MALVTRTAGSNQTPDPDQGGIAVTGISAGGHSQTDCGVSEFSPGGGGPESGTETKSAKWFSYSPALGSVVTAVFLKMTVNVFGSADANAGSGGTASSGSNAQVEYSINGGASWVTVFSGSAVSPSGAFSNSGPVNFSVSLGATQNIGDIRVRDHMHADGSAQGGEIQSSDASAGATVEISNLRVEITTQDQLVIVLM